MIERKSSTTKLNEEEKLEINLQGKKLQEIRNKALENIEEFWAQQANNLIWSKKWDKILDWNPPFAKWFLGGVLNTSVNCLDNTSILQLKIKRPLYGKVNQDMFELILLINCILK